MFRALHLPKAALKLSKKGNDYFVWCVARKKQLLLTPEEWVRQHAIHFLISYRNVPLGLIVSEQGIQVNQLARRCDIVVYGNNQEPKILVECKSPDIALNTTVLHQIAQYNAKLNVDYLWITNGLEHHFYYINRQQKSLQKIEDLPDYFLI